MPFAIYDRASGKYLTVNRDRTAQYEQAQQIEDLYEARTLRDSLNVGGRRLALAESRFDWRVPRRDGHA